MRIYSSFALTCATLLSLSACGHGEDTAPGAEPRPEHTSGTMGEPVASGDFVITVTEFREDVQLLGITPENPDRTHTLVHGTVTNNSKDLEIDLSCGTTLYSGLFNHDNHHATWIDNLADVPGNPPCGEFLSPGQSRDMTWVADHDRVFSPSWFGFMEMDNAEQFSQIELR